MTTLENNVTLTSHNDEVLKELKLKHINGEEFSIFDVIKLVDLQSDHKALKKWLFDEKLATSREWYSAVKRDQVAQKLGAYPETASKYVELRVKRDDIEITFKSKVIKRNQQIYYGDINATAELAQVQNQITDMRKSQNGYNPREFADLLELERAFLDVVSLHTIESDIETEKRNMRIEIDELGLTISDKILNDVVDAWVEKQLPLVKEKVFGRIKYAKGKATGPLGKEAWARLINATFSTSDESPALIEAVLRKFMWQVKRKMLGLPVTNHLMPVFLGPQGAGKSTLIKLLIEPVVEMTEATDFNTITDGKTINIWRNLVLVFDEMGYASRADIEKVKYLITAGTVDIRKMHTNNTTPVVQSATFIGSSNKEIDQLIKDETGNRRFIGLQFKGKADVGFDVINTTDYEMLWQSVDKRASDPMDPYLEELNDKQKESRVLSPVEEWAQTYTGVANKWRDRDDLYPAYKEWEEINYSKKKTDLGEWVREMSRLIKNEPTFPFERKRANVGYSYLYNGVQNSVKSQPAMLRFPTKLRTE